jgi:hypothetical protein
MAKYAEVQAKKDNVDKMHTKDEIDESRRGIWVGFTFGKADVSKGTRDALRNQKDIEEGEDGREGLFTIF